jgi:hypothetical protein
VIIKNALGLRAVVYTKRFAHSPHGKRSVPFVITFGVTFSPPPQTVNFVYFSPLGPIFRYVYPDNSSVGPPSVLAETLNNHHGSFTFQPTGGLYFNASVRNGAFVKRGFP